MRYMRRNSRFNYKHKTQEDPIAGVANLFDASIVLIVSLMIALFMAYDMLDLLNPDSVVTITKESADGEVEIITKKGSELKAEKITDKEMSGSGERLGTAYRLNDGRMIYVPE